MLLRALAAHIQYVSRKIGLQLIELLQRLKMGAALHEARQAMHALFPLTEGMWLSWLEAERPKLEPTHFHALCGKAVQDYLCISLWEHFVR